MAESVWAGPLVRAGPGAASEDYLVAAPDLYYWGSRLRCLWTIMREVTAGHGRTVADIDAARDWLSARPGLHRADRRDRMTLCRGPEPV